jgi:hypothetical protein
VNSYAASILKIAGISESERRDGRLMSDIAKVTRIDPGRRKERLQQFVASLRSHPQASQVLARWGFQLRESRQPKRHAISPPKLVMSRDHSPVDVPLNEQLKFQGVLKDQELCETIAFGSNYLIVAPTDYRNVVETELIRMLRDMDKGLGLGLRFPPADTRFVANAHPNDYCNAISAAVRRRSPPQRRLGPIQWREGPAHRPSRVAFTVCQGRDADRRPVEGYKPRNPDRVKNRWSARPRFFQPTQDTPHNGHRTPTPPPPGAQAPQSLRGWLQRTDHSPTSTPMKQIR